MRDPGVLESTAQAAGRLGQWTQGVIQATPAALGHAAEGFLTQGAGLYGRERGWLDPSQAGTMADQASQIAADDNARQIAWARQQDAAAMQGQPTALASEQEPLWRSAALGLANTAAQGAAGGAQEKLAANQLAGDQVNPVIAAAGDVLQHFPISPGVAGNAAMAMMPLGGPKAAAMALGGIPTFMEATGIPQAAGQLGSFVQPDVSQQSHLPSWVDPSLMAAVGTVTDPSVTSQYPAAGLMGLGAFQERAALPQERAATLDRPVQPDTPFGMGPVQPETYGGRAKAPTAPLPEAPKNPILSYLATSGEGVRDMADLAKQASDKINQRMGPAGAVSKVLDWKGNGFDALMGAVRNIPDMPQLGYLRPVVNSIAGVAKDFTGTKTTTSEDLAAREDQPAADEATAALARANTIKTAGANASNIFKGMVQDLASRYGTPYARLLFQKMDSLNRPDAGLQPAQLKQVYDVSTPEAESNAYWKLKQRAYDTFDQSVPSQTSPSFSPDGKPLSASAPKADPAMAAVREAYAQYAAHQVVMEAKAGLHDTQPGQIGPRAQGFYHAQGNSPQFNDLQVGDNPSAAEAQLRAKPGMYGTPGDSRSQALLPNGEANMNRDRDALQAITTHLRNLQKRGEQMLTGRAPATMGEADLPELPSKGDHILTPAEREASGQPLPGQPALKGRAQLVHDALAPSWANDPVKSKALDAATAALAKGSQPTAEGIQALKDGADELRSRLQSAPALADTYFKVVDEMQRQAKQAGTGYAYSGHTVESVIKNLNDALENEAQGRAGLTNKRALEFSERPEAFHQRTQNDRIPIRDPAFAAKAAWSTLTSQAAFKALADGMKYSPFVQDLDDTKRDENGETEADKARGNGYVQVPNSPKFGAMAAKYVPKELWEQVAPYEAAHRPDSVARGVMALANELYRMKGVGSLSAVNRNIATMLWQAHAHLGIGPLDWHRIMEEGLNADNDPTNYEKFRGMDYGVTPGTSLPQKLGVPPPESSMRPTMEPGGRAEQAWNEMEAKGEQLRGLQEGSWPHQMIQAMRVASKAVGDSARNAAGEGVASTLSPDAARQLFGQWESVIRKGAAQLLIKDKGLTPEQAIAQSNQAFVDYANKSRATKSMEQFGIGAGNRFIHWPLAAAGNTARLLTSPNPMVWGRVMAAPLAAAAWAVHLGNIGDAMAVQRVLQNNKFNNPDDRDKAVKRALQWRESVKDQDARNVPDWVRGYDRNLLGSGVMEVPIKQESTRVHQIGKPGQVLPDKYVNRTNYLSIGKANPYDAFFGPIDMAFHLQHLTEDFPAGEGGQDDSGLLTQSLPAKAWEMATGGASPPGFQSKEAGLGPTNQAAGMRAALDAFAPPQFGQAAGLGQLQEDKGAAGLNQIRGAAPDEGTTLANRWLGALGAWHNDAALQALRGANKLDQAGKNVDVDVTEWPHTSVKHLVEQDLPVQVKSLKGEAHYREGK